MTGLKEQAQQLIEFDKDTSCRADLVHYSNIYASAIAQAYLDQCEANERLREIVSKLVIIEKDLCFGGLWNTQDGMSAFIDARDAARKALGGTDV